MRGGLLRERDVRLIVTAVGISALGDFVVWVALTLQLQETTGSGLAVAGLMICLWTPVVVLAGWAGLLVDRLESRSVLIWASLAQALIAGALALALDSVAAILILAAALGIFNAISQPAEFALVPVIAGGKRLTEINGYVESARYGGMIAGPLVGGALAAAGGVEAAMLINGVTFLTVAAAGALLTARRPAAEGLDGHEAEPRRARDGIVHLMRDSTLRIVIGAVFVSLLFMSASITAEVFFLRDDLEVSPSLYGIIFASWTFGMVVGALVVARRIAVGSLAAATLAAIAVQGAGLGAPTAVLAAAFAGGAWFVGGIGHGTKNVLARSLIQQRVPDRLHGRAFAAYNGIRNSAELVALAGGGVLVAAIGGRTTLALAGGFSMLAGLGGLLVYRRRGAGLRRSQRIEPGELPQEPA